MARAVGWRVERDAETAIRDTVRWYQANEWWWRPLKSGEYWDYYRKNYKPLTASSR
jgi:dTDP-glucose 4,6-dehydratase